MADAEGCDGAARQGQAGGHVGPACPRDSGDMQLGQRQQELELCSAMAATALGASDSAREGVNEEVGSGSAREGGEGRSGARLWRSRALGSAWRRARMHVSHGRARSGAWLPRRHFAEHVARVAVLDLEAVRGMLAC